METDLTAKLLADADDKAAAGVEPLISDEADQPAVVAIEVPAGDDEHNRKNAKSDQDFHDTASDDESSNLPEFFLDPQQVFATQDYARGELQPATCRDLPFALLWYAQLIAVIVVAAVLGIPALSTQHEHHTHDSDDTDDNDNNNDDGDTYYSYTGILYFTLLSGLACSLLNAVAMSILANYGTYLIQISILFSVFVSLGMAIVAALQGSIMLAILSSIGFLIGLCYYHAIYDRIPFAAANLSTGLTAVRKNLGVVLVAYGCVGLTVLFCAVWTMAVMGVADKFAPQCSGDGDNDGSCNDGMNEAILFVFLVSLYWTQQVLSNVVHVSVAGVVGTWWFAPDEASSFCSKGVTDSLVRATTTSFGSICFGSLLVAVVRALRQIVQNARRDNDGQGDSVLLCLAECILACLEGTMLYFNKWAFIYVGLYGYDYLSAGRNVMDLFDARGWTVIINDDMVSNTLSLTCLVLGSLSGCVGMLISSLQGGSWLDALGSSNHLGGAFLIAFVLGLITSNILMGIVDSAVSTAIVSFAEAPADFQQNHPALYDEMVTAWRKVYGEECGF